MTLSPAERLERELVLRAMFPAMPGESLVRLTDVMESVTFPARAVVFAADLPAERLYFIRSGRVELVADGEAPWTFGPRSVVGMIDAVIARPHARTCRTLEPTEFFTLEVSEWVDLLEDDVGSARAGIRNLAFQVHSRRQALGAISSLSAADSPSATEPERLTTIGPERLTTTDKIIALRASPFLKTAGMQAIASLAGLAVEEHVVAGQLLFDAAAPLPGLRVIVAGRIELASGDGFRIIQGSGELIGGAAAFGGALDGYAARALRSALILIIQEQDFYDQLEEHVRLTRGTLAYLVIELERLLRLRPP